MGWVPVVVGSAATALFHSQGRMGLLAVSVICAVGALWSYGVMHNFAMEAAKRRPDFTGGFYDISRDEADAVPDGLAMLNIILSLGSFLLFGLGVILNFWF